MKKQHLPIMGFLAFVVLLVICALIPRAYRQLQEYWAEQKRIKTTEQFIQSTLDAIEVDPDTGRFNQNVEMPVDAWHHPLISAYEKGDFVNDYVTIKSLGPDGIANTSDDIQKTKFRLSMAVTSEKALAEAEVYLKKWNPFHKEKE
jgi:hypothetical protein